MLLARQQALDYFHSDDLIGLGMEADALRRKLHPEGVVTYIIDRSIDYGPRQNEGNFFNLESIYDQIAEIGEMGGTGVRMQGSLDSELKAGLKIEWFEGLLRGIGERFPEIWLHGFSAPEILAIVEWSDLSLRDTIMRLRDAGLRSIPGDGSDILDDEARYEIGRPMCRTEDWVAVHRTAHELGLRTTATMLFGMGETFEQRLNYIDVVRRLQEETGGFTAFIPASFQPNRTAVGGPGPDEVTSVEYLKVLAISRLYLDNIDNVQSCWLTQGLKVLQMGLRFGGNDVGSVMLEESVAKGAGASNPPTEEDLKRIIRDAGFIPAQRDTLYTTMFLN